jgi:hypothetical protein
VGTPDLCVPRVPHGFLLETGRGHAPGITCQIAIIFRNLIWIGYVASTWLHEQCQRFTSCKLVHGIKQYSAKRATDIHTGQDQSVWSIRKVQSRAFANVNIQLLRQSSTTALMLRSNRRTLQIRNMERTARKLNITSGSPLCTTVSLH